jgi:biofilm PGA synthesis N-glycosyltransferase PgaC
VQLIIFTSLGLFVIYGGLVIYYWYTWRSVPVFTAPPQASLAKLSVIIPARNEEKNIGGLLNALKEQSYASDRFEVIVVDDHSTDQTATIVKQFPWVHLIQMDNDSLNSYKKKAIETGIAAAKGELIVTTDADCIPGPGWLQTVSDFYHARNSVFIAAPVSINCDPSILQIFQSMDFMVLQGITGAVVHGNQMSMCNGANLAYQRQSFYSVNGFSGIDHIASGDDMLLMYKIEKQNPGKVHYLKSQEAIVSTIPAQSWKEFFQQRIRWASKAARYQDKRILPILLVVYFFNLCFLFLFIGMFWNVELGFWFLGLWLGKTLVEFPLFISVANFFNKQWAIRWFLLFQPLHIGYTIISGFFSQFGKYEWKGRKVR